MSTWYYANLVLVQATLTGLLMALSVQVPLRMGVFSFAGVGSYGIGAYTAALLVIHLELSSLAAIGLAVVMTAFIGLLLGLVIARLAGLYLAMATVAFDLIIGVIAINGGTFTGSSTGLYGVLSDFTMPLMWVLTLVALTLVVLSEHGKVGRRVHAVRDDIQLAASAGINVRRYRLVAFVVSGALGGLAGAMNVMVRTTIGPLDIGFHLIVLALTMIIVGGAMSWKGAVIGAIIFTWLPPTLDFVGEWQHLLYGIIVAVAAVLLPRGIHGVFVDITRAIQRSRRKPVVPPPAELEPEPDLEPLMTTPTSGSAQPGPGGTSSTSLLGGEGMTAQPTESTATAPESSGTPVLELRDVAVHFGGVKAVDGITMKLHPGLIYGIIGPNGSGKTTLIGAITRLTRLTRGDMLFDGESYTSARPNRLVDLGVARTFQTVRLLPDLDVARNIQLGADARTGRGKARSSEGRESPAARFKGLLSGGSEPSPAVAAAIARTGLEGFERHYPTELSYGTQRRIEIARAMAMEPRLLLLDEPTAGMNQAERHEISALLRDMRSEGSLCQLLVEHDVQMMIDTCDYVFAMNTGKLIAEGEPQEVVRNPLVQEAYLGRKFREHA